MVHTGILSIVSRFQEERDKEKKIPWQEPKYTRIFPQIVEFHYE